MNLVELMRVSLRSIRANKLRSILTMLGIIIGVAAVIAMVSIGQGATASVSSQIEGLGSNLLIVTPGQATQGGVKMGAGSLDTLTLNDAAALGKLNSVAGVAPDITSNGQAVYNNTSYSTTIEGTSQDYPTVRNAQVTSGRFFNNFDVKAEGNVAVLGASVVENLFGSPDANVVGQTININQTPFEIIGVLQSQGSTGSTNNDDRILIPVSTAMNRLLDKSNIRTLFVSAKSADQMDQAQFDIEQALRGTHNLKPTDVDDFPISSQAQILSTAQGVERVLTSLLAGIAGISLLVGGIGIMNIMLVSVTERTREIGIRKAIGATRGIVLRQFLLEAVTLSVMGGVIGIALGVGIAESISHFTSTAASLTYQPILYSFLFSLLVGVIFGVYPARKASLLNPIDALRYE